MKTFGAILILILIELHLFGQPIGITFQDAESQGIIVKDLDSLYQSAVHVDSTQAVFQTQEEQEKVYNSYKELLQGLGDFLKANNYKWAKPTTCFNRIYFNENGGIDYYIFNFRGKPEDKPSAEQELEFTRLVNLFIQDYKFGLTAEKKFTQCSPTTFMPSE